jgi:hypothetical protein
MQSIKVERLQILLQNVAQLLFGIVSDLNLTTVLQAAIDRAPAFHPPKSSPLVCSVT